MLENVKIALYCGLELLCYGLAYNDLLEIMAMEEPIRQHVITVRGERR